MSAGNRLLGESSPYLRQHAQNPVDWYPWSEEALTKARTEDKPILLSIGYSACHWCHVMAHESFEAYETARLMNELYVNVKVDREERPDLDQLYQGVVQLMGKGGGWPLTVFLTPDLKPFYGGTYFPPTDRFGLPGFARLLVALGKAWRDRREEVLREAEAFKQGLGDLAELGIQATPASFSADELVQAAYTLESAIDRQWGGFGGAPKFPNPMGLAAMLRAYRRSKSPRLLSAVRFSLERMALGGICDQLGGGFHRYSVDARWEVPHFEKMLYDNALLLHLYAEAQQLGPCPLWEETAEGIAAWVGREMTAADGSFFSSQDADSDGEEGKYFVWSWQEMESLLPAPLLELAEVCYGVTPEGNFEGGRTVLAQRREVAEIAQELGRTELDVARQLSVLRTRLLQARGKRVPPGVDRKVISGWNGLMVRGLAFASRVFNRPEWAEWASNAVRAVLGEFAQGGELARLSGESPNKFSAVLEDYGHLAAGLLALYQATFAPELVLSAEKLAAQAVELFWDQQRQVYHAARRGQPDLLVNPYALHDNAVPSGASTLTEAQVVLYSLTGNARYLEQADRYLKTLSREFVENPFAFGHLLLAADSFAEGAPKLVILGEPEHARELLGVANSTFAPAVTTVVLGRGNVPPPPLAAPSEAVWPVPGRATAYLCLGARCEPPVTSGAELREILGKSASVAGAPVTRRA